MEISWFVIMPIWREANVWIRRGGIKTARLLGWLVALLGAGSLFPLVSGNTVRAPAWAHSSAQHALYSPMAARVIEAPARDGPIRAGQVLYVLDVPEIRNKEVRSDSAAQALNAQIAGRQGEKDGEEKRAVLSRQLAREMAEGASQRAEIRRLVLRAPENGMLVDVDQDVRAGVWVSPKQPLGTSIDPASWLVDAFIQQQDPRTVHVGSAASFYPARDASAPLPGRVVDIDTARTLYLPNPMLDTEHGGQIVARTVRAGQAMLRDALYRVQIGLDAPPPWRYARVGSAVIDVKRTSRVPQWVNDLIVVVIRETGF